MIPQAPAAGDGAALRLRPFRLADLGRLEPPLLSPRQLERLCSFPPPPGLALTAEAAGRALGCAGVIAVQDSRVGRAWAILGSELRARPMVLHRRVARLLPGIARELRLEAIEARVRADYAAGRRWLAALGFACRGPDPGRAADPHLLYERRFPAPPAP